MTQPYIKAENLCKKYSRNAQNHLSYGLSDFMRELSGRSRQTLRKDEFFAVNDISFELARGDSFALIGRNGSGKTTLLKMLNGLVKPDGGRVTIAGRVQALINLGAGFSPRLSGMENIYSSASLMGLSRRETMDLVDTIVDFSELEDFINSPVGTYSSGMKARLGFSVAVHLNPDILLIDEILAVGDFAFQNKCYARMEQLKHSGVTIVLVSHSHSKVIQLCERAIWMHEGKLMFQGSAQDSVKAYLRYLEEQEEQKTEKATVIAPNTEKKAPSDVAVGIKAPEPEKLFADVHFGVSEPKTSETTIQLPAARKHLRIAGWYAAPESRLIEGTINGEPLELEMMSRPDVEARFPECEIATGFRIDLDRGKLGARSEIHLYIDGVLYWSKLILVDENASLTSLVNSGLFGPVYETSVEIEGVSGELLVDNTPTRVVPIHSEVVLRYQYRLLKPVSKLHMTLNFFRKDGTLVAAIPSLEKRLHLHIKEGLVSGEIRIPDFNLTPENYVIMMPICDGKRYLSRNLLFEIRVSGGGGMYWGYTDFTCEHIVKNE